MAVVIRALLILIVAHAATTRAAPVDEADVASVDPDGARAPHEALPVERAPDAPAVLDAPSAADVADAPRPGAASGRLAPDADPLDEDGVLRRGARAVLWLPRQLLRAAFWPLQRVADFRDQRADDTPTAVAAADRSGLSGTPLVVASSTHGLSLGATLSYRAKRSETVTLEALTLGRYDHAVAVVGNTGARLGGLTLAVRLDSEDRPEERFFGLGTTTVGEAGTALDPRADRGVESRFAQRRTRARLRARAGRGAAWAQASAQVAWLRIGAEDLGARYVTDDLDGLGAYTATTGALGVGYDSRTTARPWIPAAAPSSGWRAHAEVGMTRADGASHATVDLGAARLLDLFAGTRVVTLRAHLQAALGDVPLVSLPSLGGAHALRGYPPGRFRDHLALAATLEYRYPVYQAAGVYLFADAGRVWQSVADIGWRGYRFSYGGGVELYAGDEIRAQLHGALTPDEGGQLYLSVGRPL